MTEYFCVLKRQQLLDGLLWACEHNTTLIVLSLVYSTTQCGYITLKWLWIINPDVPLTNFPMCLL